MNIKEEIKKIDDPEILKKFMGFLIDEVERAKLHINKLEAIQAKRDQLKFSFDDKMSILRKLIFGKGKEVAKGVDDIEVGLRDRSLQNQELLMHSQSLVPSPQEEKIESLHERVEIFEMEEMELERASTERGVVKFNFNDWKEIKGLYEESTEVTITERTYEKVRYKRKKYRYEPSKGTGNEIIVTAAGPEKFLPGTSYSIDFAVSVVSDKYLFHMPLERQRRKMESLGLKGIQVKTLYNMARAISVQMEPVVKSIKGDILSANLAVGCDETPWPILNKKDSNGYLWVISNQAGSYYQFEPSRSGKVIEEILMGYEGPIITDAFSGYNRLKDNPKLTNGYCWAHARRKFIEIQNNYPDECREILFLMKRIFKIEHEAKSWNDLKRLRQDKTKIVIDEIYRWLLSHKVKYLPESGFSKAINYLLRRWQGFKAFLYDEKIPLTNNDVERTIRHSVLGRRNFHGSKSIDGADVAATLYTVIESCKKVELDPTGYMKYVVIENWHGREVLTPLQYAKRNRAFDVPAE